MSDICYKHTIVSAYIGEKLFIYFIISAFFILGLDIIMNAYCRLQQPEFTSYQ